MGRSLIGHQVELLAPDLGPGQLGGGVRPSEVSPPDVIILNNCLLNL